MNSGTDFGKMSSHNLRISTALKLCIRTVQQCPRRNGILQSVHARYQDARCNTTKISVLRLIF